MKTGENEYTMETLAALAGKDIAKKNGISDIQGFDLLMNSKTGKMLFEDNYNLLHNTRTTLPWNTFWKKSGLVFFYTIRTRTRFTR
ncbi:hypothetical protein [uncultured Treponema sp.]|uniref:hypothetical protein n=1 Tax=uncultured Treponema sp. TaxID=162155 RepID=UPI0025EBBA41|nr:hypothetical protein [uncultured Treponema sp.]